MKCIFYRIKGLWAWLVCLQMLGALECIHAQSEPVTAAAILEAVGEGNLVRAEQLIDEVGEHGSELGADTLEELRTLLKKERDRRVNERLANFSLWDVGLTDGKALERAAAFRKKWGEGHQRIDLEDAISAVHAHLSEKPGDFRAMDDLAGLLRDHGDYHLSVKWSLKAMKSANTAFLGTPEGRGWEARALNNMAWTHVITGDFVAAHKWATFATSRLPDDASSLHTLASACMGLAANPSLGEGKDLKAVDLAHRSSEFTKQALKHLDQIIGLAEKEGNDAREILATALADRGIVRVREEDFVRAVEDLQKALELEPKNVTSERWREALEAATSNCRRAVVIKNDTATKLTCWTQSPGKPWVQSELSANGGVWRDSIPARHADTVRVKFRLVPEDPFSPTRICRLRTTLVQKEDYGPVPEYSFKEASSYFVWNIPDGETLNIRGGPGTAHSTVGSLAKGDSAIQITGEPVWTGGDDWVPISFEDKTGWTRPKFLRRAEVGLFLPN